MNWQPFTLCSVSPVVRRGVLLLAIVCWGAAHSGELAAADFKLIATSIQSSSTGSPTNATPRFTLTQAHLAPVVASAPSSGTRFALQSQAGAVVLVQQPGLPQLRLQSRGADLELDWDEPILLLGLILESSAAAARGLWQTEATEITPTGRRYLVRPSTPGASTRFYRLRKP